MPAHHLAKPAPRLLAVLLTLAALLLTTAGDWPAYLHDPQRSGNGADETTLSPSNAGALTKLWSFKTGASISAAPTVAGGVVYIGSWDGYEYALDAVTGAPRWKQYLGITTDSNCNPQVTGVSSSATVRNGVVYVGGGDSYWYALDAATGAVLWRVYTGDNSPGGGHHNWSSPLIYNGAAYVGVASFGDCPLVQGQLLKIDLSTHQVAQTFNVVPNGQTGGAVWSSSAIDPATNTLYATTGNEGQEPSTSQPYALSMVALNAATLAPLGAWQIPSAQNVGDSDWGATPVVFDDAAGQPLVAAENKNGYIYAFNRDDVTAGPVWERQIQFQGNCPQCGTASIAPAAANNGVLYVGGGDTTINGAFVPGSVRALDAAMGNVLWEHASPGIVIGAVTYANGLVIDAAGNNLEVLNAATGASLYSYTTGAPLYDAPDIAPSISNGEIFMGATDGSVYAFGLGGAGTHTGLIAAARGFDGYTFSPHLSGPASIGSCALSGAGNTGLYVFDSHGALLGGSATPSPCNWVSTPVTATQTYTVVTVDHSPDYYRSAWSVAGTPVLWDAGGVITATGRIGSFGFPTLSTAPITLATCGPAGSNYDLYLTDASNAILAKAATPSTCESLSYTPSVRGLFRVVEYAASGSGIWLGTIKTT